MKYAIELATQCELPWIIVSRFGIVSRHASERAARLALHSLKVR